MGGKKKPKPIVVPKPTPPPTPKPVVPKPQDVGKLPPGYTQVGDYKVKNPDSFKAIDANTKAVSEASKKQFEYMKQQMELQKKMYEEQSKTLKEQNKTQEEWYKKQEGFLSQGLAKQKEQETYSTNVRNREQRQMFDERRDVGYEYDMQNRMRQQQMGLMNQNRRMANLDFTGNEGLFRQDKIKSAVTRNREGFLPSIKTVRPVRGATRGR